MRNLVALVAALALLAPGSPSRAAGASPPPRYPQAFATDLGTTKLIGESDADAPVSGVQIFVAAGLDREAPNKNGVAALVAECILRTPVGDAGATPLPLRDAVVASGGSITYTIDGRSAHYYVEGRAEDMGRLLGLMGKALAAPDFSAPTLAAARASLTGRVNELENSALLVGIEMFRRSYYLTSAAGPALGTPTTLALLTRADAMSFYLATYRRRALSVSAVGRIAPELAGQVQALADALPDGPVSAVNERARIIPALAPRIVAHRDVAAPWVVVGFAAPAPNSRDFGAMLVLESLLSDAFERSSTTTLGIAEKSVGASYLYDSTPASLIVYVNGTEIDPSLALRELLVVSKSLAQKPIGADMLRRFKLAAEGQFLENSVDLADRSYLLGTFASQGLGSDAINTALAALESTSAADVQRVAKNYLQRYIVALVLPRDNQGS